MFTRKTALCLILFSISTSCFAQFYPTQYRPPNQRWQYLSSPHFELVYSEGNYPSALRMGRILEQQYPTAQELVGGSLESFPVILNYYNDRSNGFVTPFNFRSEIELPPIKGKVLNPHTGNWLENVGPHELVHALQFSHLGDYNLPQLVSLFSPDLARSFHVAIPLGIPEGIAVYHETKSIAPYGGRGNFPIYTNQFDATFTSDLRWSMGQLVQISSYTRPFNRHYIGGYEFTSWLQDKFGRSTTREALDFYMDFPFLGYGVALRHVTGFWPGELYNRFEDNRQKLLEDKELSSRVHHLNIPFEGSEIRRPKWLSDSTLIFHGSFYNARPGFYSYRLKSGKMNRLITTETVNDFQYDLSADKSEIVFSYLEASPIYDNTYKAELIHYNFSTGQKQQLTDNGRLYAPVFFDGGLLALQTRPASSRMVLVEIRMGEATSIDEVLYLGNQEIVAVAENPVNDQLAVVVNKHGMQALWIANFENLAARLQQPPDVSFAKGSVFDPAWHPDGSKIMFSSGFSGTHQLYEYDLEEGIVIKITDASFNAFEGAYSPGGNRIAFVKQVENWRLPAVINRGNFEGTLISPAVWQFSDSKFELVQRPIVSDSVVAASQNWESGDYSSGLNWLKPRTVLPVFEEVANQDTYQFGMALHSNDLLQSQSYSAELTYLEERLWYDVTYQNKTFYPGFNLRYYSQPSYNFFTVETQNETITNTLLQQERSLSLSVPFQFSLNQNVFFSSLFVEPEVRLSQIRFFELGGNSKSSFSNVVIGGLYAQFNYRLQQNIRDLQPNSGMILYSDLEYYLNSDSINFTAYGYELPISFNRIKVVSGGLYTYFSPLRRWNQSLRLGLEAITQSDQVFNNQSFVSEAFSEPVFRSSNNLLSFSTRYTLPLFYVDNGGFLLPLYLSNVYLVAFSNTVTDPAFDDWLEGSRSVFGIGIRTRFRVSNLAFDVGIGFGFEPTRGNAELFIGDF